MVTEYPREDAYRGGCKVRFLYFRDEKKAKAASRIAIKIAKEKRELGYEFGYRTPGEITYYADGMYAHMWEVVIP